jgi:hypothetical protein
MITWKGAAVSNALENAWSLVSNVWNCIEKYMFLRWLVIVSTYILFTWIDLIGLDVSEPSNTKVSVASLLQ